jgi:hypothetical protein
MESLKLTDSVYYGKYHCIRLYLRYERLDPVWVPKGKPPYSGSAPVMPKYDLRTHMI